MTEGRSARLLLGKAHAHIGETPYAVTLQVGKHILSADEPKQRTRLLNVAAQCPVQRTLENNPVITTLVGTADAAPA